MWIRSQDKRLLTPIDKPISQFGEGLFYEGYILGTYKTKDRALEVLDEIQDKLKTILYLKPKVSLALEDLEPAKRYYERLNKQELITCDSDFEIVPISSDVIVFKMPES